MRLLPSYCNRERQTAHLENLKAHAEGQRAARRPVPVHVARRPKRLSPETNAAIVADYQSGMKSTAIARKYEINEGTVHHRLKRARISKRPQSMSEQQIELAQALRADGWAYDRIAERVGFSSTTVRNMLSRYVRRAGWLHRPKPIE